MKLRTKGNYSNDRDKLLDMLVKISLDESDILLTGVPCEHCSALALFKARRG
jgi:hypothetical protein